MVEKKIKSLIDGELKTAFGFHMLSLNEVKLIQFANEKTFKALLTLGVIEEANADEKVVKKIPVILPEVIEEELVAVESETLILHDLVSDEAPEKLEISEEVDYWDRSENQKQRAEIEASVEGTEKMAVDPLGGIDPDKPDLPYSELLNKNSDIAEDGESPKFEVSEEKWPGSASSEFDASFNSGEFLPSPEAVNEAIEYEEVEPEPLEE